MPKPFRRSIRALALAVGLLAGQTAVAHADVAFTRSDIAGVNGATAVALGDLDGKNGPDLVTTGGDGLQVRLGNGDGTFGAPSTISTTNGNSSCVPFQVQVADVAGGYNDLAGDGANDLVIACSSGVYQGRSAGGVLARVPGNGNGTFGDILVSGIGTASSPQSNETRFALAEWRESGPPVVVFPGEGYSIGEGTFHVLCWSYDWVTTDCTQTRIAYGPLVAGEADGGDFDEVLTMGKAGELQTFGIDTGSVGPPRLQSWGTTSTAPGTHWSNILVGDIQHDGRPDVITTSSSVSDGFVNVILGVPGMLGYTANPIPSSARLAGGALIDADGDGLLDFVGALNNGQVIMQRATTAGTFAAPEPVAGSGFVGDPNYGIAPVASGDLDGNGTTDFVVASPGASTVEVLLNGAVAAGGGTGPGTGTNPGTGSGGVPGQPQVPGAPQQPQTQPIKPLAKLVITNLRTKGRTLSVEVNLPATVRFQVQRCKAKTVGGKTKTTCKTLAKLTGSVAKAGRISIKLPDKIAKGRYLVKATATGAAPLQNELVVPKK